MGHVATSVIDYLGNPFEYPEDNLIGRFLEDGRGWDSFLRVALPILVEEDEPVICEDGSNIGASLMQMLAAKPKGRFYAFEPSLRFRPYLLRNVHLAGAEGRVEVRPWFLGTRRGRGILYVSASSASGVGADLDPQKRRGTQTVSVRTLDSELGGERVNFLKVDTDGYEFEVLRGAEGILKQCRPAMHFEFATYLIPQPLSGLRWLGGLGYRRFIALTALGGFIGATTDPEQVVEWAEGTKHGYCDIITAAEGTTAEGNLAELPDVLDSAARSKPRR